MKQHWTKDEGHLAGVAIDIFAHPRYWRGSLLGQGPLLLLSMIFRETIFGSFMRELGYKLSFRFLW